jgi:hypothetical protein
MPRETLELGSSPCDEDCAQVGTDNYQEQSRKECRAYVNQLLRLLRKQFGVNAADAIACDTLSVSTKSFAHDFGSYKEVVVKFDDSHPQAIEMAFWLESNLPSEWDTMARVELGLTVSYADTLPIVKDYVNKLNTACDQGCDNCNCHTK